MDTQLSLLCFVCEHKVQNKSKVLSYTCLSPVLIKKKGFADFGHMHKLVPLNVCVEYQNVTISIRVFMYMNFLSGRIQGHPN